MKFLYYSIKVKTEKQTQFIDLTEKVKEKVKESKIKNGFVLVFSKHSTTAVLVNEKEPNLQESMAEFLEKLSPSSERYPHDEIALDGRPNTHSHLKSLLMNSNAVVPVKNSELLTGKWQSIFFLELDGPREREVVVQVSGE
jgi:secondary thiamine-phosphate synthase enzyme